MLNVTLAKNKMENEEGMNHVLVNVEPKKSEKKITKPLAFLLILDASGSMGQGAAKNINPMQRHHFIDPNLVNNQYRVNNGGFPFENQQRQSFESNTKLNYVKQAAVKFVSKLGENDYVSVVSFSDTAIVESELKPATTKNKQEIRVAIENIHTRGATNISSALREAYEQISDSIKKTHHVKMILLSDGEANSGVRTADGIASFVSEYAKDNISVSTIGVGVEYNSFFMDSIATASGGMLYHLKEMEQLEDILKDEMEKMSSLTTKQAKIKIETPEGIFVSTNMNGFHEEKKGVIFLGNLYNPQEVLVELYTEKEVKTGTYPVQVSFEYYDEEDAKCKESKEVMISLVAEEDMEDVEVNEKVVNIVKEMMEAKSKKEALQFYEKGDIQSATRSIVNTQTSLNMYSASYGIDFVDSIQEATQFQADLQNKKISQDDVKHLYSENYMRTRSKGKE